MEYVKINTVQNRDKKGKIILNSVSKPHFDNIKWWHATEKIDGTNIRVDCEIGKGYEIKGKTDNADLHPLVIEGVHKCFSDEELIDGVFSKASTVVLYGEGYGPKVNNGGKYRKDHSFILFDVLVDNKWWLDYAKVKDIADHLNIDVVPSFGMMTIESAMTFVKSEPKSLIADCIIEGLVLTPEPVMLFNDGTPIKTKIKVKDYKQC